ARLGPGSGSALIELTSQENCAATASGASPWIHLPATILTDFVPLAFTFEPNATGSPRTGTVTISGQTYTFVQDAVAPRMPLLVEPSDSLRPGGGVFRFTYADGGLTGQLTETQISFGSGCSATYHRGTNSFDYTQNSSCTWKSAQAEASGGFLTI